MTTREKERATPRRRVFSFFRAAERPDRRPRVMKLQIEVREGRGGGERTKTRGAENEIKVSELARLVLLLSFRFAYSALNSRRSQ